MRRRGEKWPLVCGGSIFFYKPKFPETGSIRYHSSQICKGGMRLDEIRSFGTIEKGLIKLRGCLVGVHEIIY